MVARTAIMIMVWLISASSWAQEKPKKPSQLFDAAEQHYNDGNYDQALTLLNQCLKINPGFMEAYPLRAGTREQLNDPDGALTDYSIYLEQFPQHPDVLMSRGVLRYNLGF